MPPPPFDFDLLNDPVLDAAAYNETCLYFLGGLPQPGSNPWDQIDEATMWRKWKALFRLSASERRFFDENPHLRKLVHDHYAKKARQGVDHSEPSMDLDDILPNDAMTTISLTDLFPERVPDGNSNGESSNAAPNSHVRDANFEKRFEEFIKMMSQARQNMPTPPNPSPPTMAPFSEPAGGSSSRTPMGTPVVFNARADHVEPPKEVNPFNTPRVRASPTDSPSPVAKKWFDDENPYAYSEAYAKHAEEFHKKLMMSRRNQPTFQIPQLNRAALNKNPFSEAIGSTVQTSNGAGVPFGFKPNANVQLPKKVNLQSETQVNTPKTPDVPIPTVISPTDFVCVAENPAIYDEETAKQFQEFSKTLWEQQAEVHVTQMPIQVTQEPVPQVPKPSPQATKLIPQVPNPIPQVPKPIQQVSNFISEVPKPPPQVPKPSPQATKPIPQVPKPSPQAAKLVPQVPKPPPQAAKLIPQLPKASGKAPRVVNAPLKKGWLKHGLSMSKASSASSSVKPGPDVIDPVVLEDEVIEEFETSSNKFFESLQYPRKAKIPPGLVRPSVLGGFMAPTAKEAYVMATAQFGYPCGDYPSFKKYVQTEIEFNAPNDERLYRAREARKLNNYEIMFANRYNDDHFASEAEIPEPFVLGPVEKVKPPKDRSGNAQFELDCVCDPRGDDSIP